VTRDADACEVAWFAALCDDDYEQLGVPNAALLSSFEHCAAIVRTADELGYDNVLLPSGYELGIDAVAFAGGVAPALRQIGLLVAVRLGEMWTPQLARQIATLDQMTNGRLTINIISSDLPGQQLGAAPRYARTRTLMTTLRSLLDGAPVDVDDEWLTLRLGPPRVRTVGGACPPMYFGGLSEAAREVAAECADVFLMWPDTVDGVAATIDDLRRRADHHGRRLRFGYRTHVVVRHTEAEARAAAAHLVEVLDPAVGQAIRQRSLDSGSAGVRQQTELRDRADEHGYVTRHLWTGIGRGRSGCGAAIVGDPEQVSSTLREYRSIGVDTFILSGYPHLDECRRFAELVLPRIRSDW
jgi:alkanesulfonate monooxygenase